MLKRLINALKAPAETAPAIEPRDKPIGVFSTDEFYYGETASKVEELLQGVIDKGLAPMRKTMKTGAMDSLPLKSSMYPAYGGIPPAQAWWYGNQSFIGYQMAAILSQQWLVSKCCLMPARDAVRNGYEVSVNDGTEVKPELLDAIRKADVKYKLNENLIQFVNMGRIFGIRIAMFIVDSTDPKYYEKPFNPDGVTPNSYKGISQIDPYWITPELDQEAAGAPGSINFYEPTWWRVGARRIHYTHLIIFRTEEVPDILKPSYLYGGVPIPQKIAERVYAAEKTANEAPMLALTKRTDVITCDVGQAVANQAAFDKRMLTWSQRRDNYGIKIVGEGEKMEQFDTSLADLDAVIMTQYQLVAAAANVPAVKLIGTTPKGFNSTGEYEEASYHEELESIQRHDLTALLNRHHLLLIRSEIAPEAPFEVTIVWNSLDAMTAKELAELNKLKAETDSTLSNMGAIDGQDARNRIISDPESGYSGLIDDEVPDNDDMPIEEESEEQGA